MVILEKKQHVQSRELNVCSSICYQMSLYTLKIFFFFFKELFPMVTRSEGRLKRRVDKPNGGRTHRVRHVVGEWLVLGHQAAGHVRWVRQLGAVHEIIHRRTTRGDVREVKVPVPLVIVAWHTKIKKKTVNTGVHFLQLFQAYFLVRHPNI